MDLSPPVCTRLCRNRGHQIFKRWAAPGGLGLCKLVRHQGALNRWWIGWRERGQRDSSLRAVPVWLCTRSKQASDEFRQAVYRRRLPRLEIETLQLHELVGTLWIRPLMGRAHRSQFLRCSEHLPRKRWERWNLLRCNDQAFQSTATSTVRPKRVLRYGKRKRHLNHSVQPR